MTPRSGRVVRTEVAGSGVRIPVLTLHGPAVGPVVAVVANLHGDECTGIAAVHELTEVLPGALRCGSLHLYPSLNPAGLEEGSRTVPGDTVDPNRVFPGRRSGTPAERLARRIWADLTGRRPSLVIDLHTDTDGAIPYALVDRVLDTGRSDLEKRCRRLAAGSGLTVLSEYPPDRYVRFGLDHSLPGALVNGPGIAAITLEIGPRRRIDRAAVELAVQAVLGVLSAVGLMSAAAPSHPSRIGRGSWRRESGPRATCAGVLVPFVSPGERVGVGARLAEVRTIDGRVRETLTATDAGYVVSLAERAHIQAGVACATLAVGER